MYIIYIKKQGMYLPLYVLCFRNYIKTNIGETGHCIISHSTVLSICPLKWCVTNNKATTLHTRRSIFLEGRAAVVWRYSDFQKDCFIKYIQGRAPWCARKICSISIPPFSRLGDREWDTSVKTEAERGRKWWGVYGLLWRPWVHVGPGRDA